MTTYITNGPTQLSGTVSIHGTKNTALKYIFFPIFIKEKVLLTNVPKCTSITNALELLEEIGCTHQWQNNNLTIDPTQIRKENFCFETDSFFHTSGSVLLVTLLCELYGPVTIKNTSGYTDTGGDSLDRTLEKHHNFIKQYGYKIIEKNNSIIYEKTNSDPFIVDTWNSFGFSFGALSSAIFRKGTSIIKNYANIVEMNHIINTLKMLGAHIEIKSKDLIVTGSSNFISKTINNCLDKQECITFIASEYPLPATEWQVLFSPLIGLIKGNSTIIDKYYPMRMQHWEGLNILGAKGKVIKDKEGNYTGEAKVEGVKSYHSGEINVNAVREACLLIAGLSVKGSVIVNDPKDHIKRGYQDLAENIMKLGGRIQVKSEKLTLINILYHGRTLTGNY